MAAKSEQIQIRVTPEQKRVLKRLAGRAGLDVSSFLLARALPATLSRVESILEALRRDSDDRYALAELNELLSGLAAAEFREALSDVDVRGLTPLIANYVAAMTELAASQKGESAPQWTRAIEPLDEPWFAVTFTSLRPHLLRASPAAFKRRNLFVDASVGDRV